jgi:uncharacterized membrane protein
MSDLIVLGFDEVGTASVALEKLRRLQKEHLIELEDACVVTRDTNGKLRLKQSVNTTAVGATNGLRIGLIVGALVGVLTLNPIAGVAVGSVAGASGGAISGAIVDYGIDDDFIRTFAETISNNSSALFVLVKRSTADKVIPEIEPLRPKVLKTSLSFEQEEKLKAAFSAWRLMHQARRRTSQFQD